jgi:3-deoxy-D-manno-octulosonic-acid transferase
VLVSTTTPTGQKVARQTFGEASVFYFPLDFQFAVRRWLAALRPKLVVLVESEFWPNFLRLVEGAGVRTVVVNARVSDRSFPRYLRYKGMMRRILWGIDLFLAQSHEDARRLVSMGARPRHVVVTGNLKFDVKLQAELPIVAALRADFQRANAGPVLVCGSTAEGEERPLLRAFKGVLEEYPRAVMVLAPRHPQRFERVARLVSAPGLKLWRRSRWKSGESIGGGVLLLDSLGELSAAYGLGDVAFVGGSLVRRGGHNILEAAQHGIAILVGPHTENFRDIINLFRQAKAVRVVDQDTLSEVLHDLLADHAACQALGSRAAEVLHAHAGATERTLSAIEGLLVRKRDSASAAMPEAGPGPMTTTTPASAVELAPHPLQVRNSSAAGKKV